MEDRFHAVPGVVKVGISTYTPMEDNNEAGACRCRGSRIWTYPGVDREGECGVLRFSGNAGGDGARASRAQDTSTSPRWRW